MLSMTSSQVTRRLLLVPDRRAQSPTAPVTGLRRYRLARVNGDRPTAVPPVARKAI
jgi:hypothetical protein